jgi:hypothetical protein
MTALLLAPGGGPAGEPPDVTGVVTWFGAMQAQDLSSGLWSLGARLPGTTCADVEAALERREALRTWPMRGTVHLVPPRDARWMLEVLGERPLARAASRRAVLGLDEAVADRAVAVLGEALAGGGRLTRARCLQVLTEAGIPRTGQLGYHLLWYASQRGVTCIAPHVDGEQTFVLLDEWVPDPHRPGREEALATITSRYVRSHGPVSRADLAGWTGLTVADTRRGLAAAGEALVQVRVDGREMVVTRELLEGQAAGTLPVEPVDEVLALPGFDEYLLGFKDRTLMLRPEHLAAVIPGGNGVFRATLVRGGRVIGTWKRSSSSRTRTVVEVWPLTRLGARERTRVERALEPYARFLGRPLAVRWPES